MEFVTNPTKDTTLIKPYIMPMQMNLRPISNDAIDHEVILRLSNLTNARKFLDIITCGTPICQK